MQNDLTQARQRLTSVLKEIQNKLINYLNKADKRNKKDIQEKAEIFDHMRMKVLHQVFLNILNILVPEISKGWRFLRYYLVDITLI